MEDFPLYNGSLVVERDAIAGTQLGYEYGADSFYPVYVRSGNRLLVDSRIRHRLPEDYVNSNDITFLSCFDGALSEYSLVKYSTLTLSALDTLDLHGEHVLDLGSADGVLSIIAKRKGAASVHAVDKDRANEPIMRRHLAENSMRLDAIRFHALDITDTYALRDALPKDISVVVANLGPHYDVADLCAIELLRHLPRVHTFVGGGYTTHHPWAPSRALGALADLGFDASFQPFVAEREQFYGSARMAFIVRREIKIGKERITPRGE